MVGYNFLTRQAGKFYLFHTEPGLTLTVLLENLHLQLRLDPQRSAFGIRARHTHGPELQSARVGLRYRRGRQHHHAHRWHAFEISAEIREDSVHGGLRTRRLWFGPDRHGVALEMDFSVSDTHPFLVWRGTVRNDGRKPIRLERIELLNLGFTSFTRLGLQPTPGEAAQGHFRFGTDFPDLAFFSNSWGSWGFSGVCGAGDRLPRTRLGPFTAPMRINPGTPMPTAARHFASDMFAVLGDRRSREAFLVGFLSQKEHFGSIEALTDFLVPALAVWANGDSCVLDPGDSQQTDWACLHFLHLDSPDPLGVYMDAVAREHKISTVGGQARAGWSSWYRYFQDITPGVVRRNLAAAAERDGLPLDLLQIDDGWQATVGDWDRFSSAFDCGVTPLAAEIRAAGFEPGLWLAPFIVQPKSSLYRRHPEWILRNRFGLAVNAGYNWGGFNAALDLSHPEALEHASQTVGTAVHEWGFTFLKLDFLYAGALPGVRRDPKQTRAMLLRKALAALRDAAGGNAHLLGCGVPLGSAVGLFDSLRIGADVAPYWAPRVIKKTTLFKSEPDLPAARNALQNALTRAPMHRRWWVNDPDCVLLRPESDLNPDEIRTIATVAALTGGLMMISDDLAALPEASLRAAESLLPPLDRRPLVMDWFDSRTPSRLRLDLSGPPGAWHLAALFNWEDQEQDLAFHWRDFNLEPGLTYLAREFWTGKVLRMDQGGRVFKSVPAHSCLLLAVRPVGEKPLYLGGDLHISQGLEVTRWVPGPHGLRFRLERPGRVEGGVDLWLPQGHSGEGGLEKRAEGIYHLPVRFTGSLDFEIR